ncbi:hypothetical protein MA6G0728R_5039 [Mycobacteroides abscessus 6G-0728-R]|uniref:Uncharacterized protein n=1 Tax=Mycobacteroides abscessus 1948 TaxID=1299323 RepID=A0A829QLL7_9MYCO|nr:hypothetical protein MA6G0125S_5109 [Mycobacteroides abscessus 6G-0125-S]EIU40306.1 hypothetical protein MA6G0125R_4068 [Mycobacteroides abscessus 6G-0125-R]EIU90131.1 hypothetical protein MA6G0212_5095 [Mycobacteroides abscessus 6G-0212]EIU96223.1 hypothetical protein MA6G0728R_5039 [Mycobacteroides abscessus 6G-0728-R]EIV21975.1 hypothetical protein MA3A0122R_5306 [Mycobacteroides abscessus 3A-0122-R]EIV70653.1 hypothetical protein MM3A0810R_5283 [Mycobacteroides abscessus 3A-0810-R]ETZ6
MDDTQCAVLACRHHAFYLVLLMSQGPLSPLAGVSQHFLDYAQ